MYSPVPQLPTSKVDRFKWHMMTASQTRQIFTKDGYKYAKLYMYVSQFNSNLRESIHASLLKAASPSIPAATLQNTWEMP